MKKMLLVLTVVLVGSLAASASGPVVLNFSFDGFCDQMETVRYSPGPGIPKKFLTGVHDFVNCFGTTQFNVGVAGFKHHNSSLIPPGATPIDDYGDPFLAFAYLIPYNLEYLVGESPCVWANYEGTLGFGNFFIQQGTCTHFAAPTKKGHSGPPSSKR